MRLERRRKTNEEGEKENFKRDKNKKKQKRRDGNIFIFSQVFWKKENDHRNFSFYFLNFFSSIFN